MKVSAPEARPLEDRAFRRIRLPDGTERTFITRAGFDRVAARMGRARKAEPVS